MGLAAPLRDGREPALQVPAQDGLGGGLLVRRGYALHDLTVQAGLDARLECVDLLVREVSQ